jgi:hypothetical protein
MIFNSPHCVFDNDAIESSHHRIILMRTKMRTTLDIDNDVLAAAKELARQQNVSAGRVVSQLLRKVLTGQAENSSVSQDAGLGAQSVAGFRPFPAGKAVATNDAVNRLREAEGV